MPTGRPSRRSVSKSASNTHFHAKLQKQIVFLLTTKPARYICSDGDGSLFQAPISIQAVHENPVMQSQRSSELREVLRAQILVAGHDRNPRGFASILRLSSALIPGRIILKRARFSGCRTRSESANNPVRALVQDQSESFRSPGSRTRCGGRSRLTLT